MNKSRNLISNYISLINLILILIIISVQISSSQPYYKKSDYYFGASLGLDFVQHNTEFKELPNVPNCCNNFDGGNGTGLNISFLAQKRLFSYNYFLLKLGLSSFSGNLNAQQNDYIILDNKLFNAIIEHRIHTSFQYLYIEPSYRYLTYKGFSINLGLQLGLLTKKTFEQAEYLIQPENRGVFNNGKRVRNEYSGDIQDTRSILASLVFGAEYEFKLDEFSMNSLAPYVTFNYGLNSLFADRKWNINYLSIGINFRYNPFVETSSPLEPKYDY